MPFFARGFVTRAVVAARRRACCAIGTAYGLFDNARREIAGLAQLSDCRITGSGFDQAGRFLSPSVESYVVKTWHDGDFSIGLIDILQMTKSKSNAKASRTPNDESHLDRFP